MIYLVAHHQYVSSPGQNFTITIALASISVIIIFMLIVAKICVRLKEMHTRTHQYNCRLEALKMLSAVETQLSDSMCNDGVPNNSCGDGDKTRKEVRFHSMEDLIQLDEFTSSWPPGMKTHTLPVCKPEQ